MKPRHRKAERLSRLRVWWGQGWDLALDPVPGGALDS